MSAIRAAATGRMTDRSLLFAELMSAKIAVVPPTSAFVPGGAASCTASRRSSRTSVIASLDIGFSSSSRLIRATLGSVALRSGGCARPTPGARADAAAKSFTCCSVSGVPLPVVR